MQTVPLALEHVRRGGLVLLMHQAADCVLVVAAECAQDAELAVMRSAGTGDFHLAIPASDQSRMVVNARLPVYQIRQTADGGLLENAALAEAAADIVRLCGLRPQALTRVLSLPDPRSFAAQQALPIVTVEDLTLYRRRSEAVLEQVAVADLPTRHAPLPFRAHSFRSSFDAVEHLALVSPGDLTGDPLVRIHSECLTGDSFGSLRCDCGPQLDESLRRIAASPGGVLVYMRGHEGRGIGLSNKMRAYALQDKGMDTVQANRALGLPADARDFTHAAQILRTLGCTTVRLLTNNPEKAASLERHQIRVSQIEPLVIPPNPFNARYLDTKTLKFGHTIPVPWHLG